MKHVAPWIAALLFLCACPAKPDAGGSKEQPVPTGAAPSVKAPSASKDVSDTEALTLSLRALDAWVAAQNQGKLDAYLSMYDAPSFRGVKRTSTGTEQSFDFKGWKDERSRMFGSDVTVAADAPKALAWTENPGLKPGVVEVRFTQRWKNPRYADHGPKVIHFQVKSGAALIVYEELISSSPGWDDDAAAAPSPGNGKFVRVRPQSMEERVGVDACAFLGGFGFACLDALLAEKDPVKKRYMRRLSDADARQAFDQFQRNEMNGVAHAEVAFGCADSGPCAATKETSDDGYACLTKAESLMQEKKTAEAKAAQARACRCSAKRAQIPVMGGFLACDGDTPVERGKNMSSEEAAEVRACGECDGARGPAACAKEIAKLSKSDADVAAYIEKVHVPRCQKP